MTIWIDTARRAYLHQWGMQENPIFAWDNIAATATLSGTAIATDGQRENAVDGSTSSRWRPSGKGDATLIALIPANTPVSFLAIAAHSLDDAGAQVQWHYNRDATGGTWVAVTPTAADAVQGAMAWRFMPITARRWRLTVSSIDAADAATLGVFFVGNETIMPMRIYQGFAPRIVPTNVELQSNVSEGGNLIGSAVSRTGSMLELPFSIIRPDFVRGEFKPFMTHFNAGKGCFVAWRPEKYPEDLHYGWRDGPVIRPENSGPKAYMSMTVKMRLHDG